MTDLPLPPGSSSDLGQSGSQGDSKTVALDLSAAFSRAWELFKKHWKLGLMGGLYLLPVYISAAGIRYAFGQAAGMFGTLVVPFIQIAITIVFHTNYFRFLLRMVDGEEADLKEIYRLDQWTSVFALGMASTFLVMFFVGLGMLLLIIPGLFIACRFQFWNIRLAERADQPVSDFLSDVWGATRGNAFATFLSFFVQFFILFAGLLCLLIGVFPAYVLATFFQICLYRQLFPRKAPKQLYDVDAPTMIT